MKLNPENVLHKSQLPLASYRLIYITNKQKPTNKTKSVQVIPSGKKCTRSDETK